MSIHPDVLAHMHGLARTAIERTLPAEAIFGSVYLDALIDLTLVSVLDGHPAYLSTGCLHGQHEHCRCTVNVEGDPKVPGRCKFCTSECICPCHGEGKTV